MEYWTLKSLRSLAAISVCCLLIACGGGGGSPTSETGMSRADSSSTPDSSNPNNSEELSGFKLSWLIPDSRANGKDLEPYEIDGYRIYYTDSDTPMAEAEVIAINDPQITDYTFTNLPGGSYRVAIATVDIQGMQGALSGEIVANIP